MKDIIRSAENEQVKLALKLQNKKFRKEYGLYVAEGERLIKDVLAYDSELLDRLIVSESYYDTHTIPQDTVDVHVVTDVVFEKAVNTENSQGIVALLRKKQPRPPNSSRCLYLDRVRDPGNLGTIVRTASAFGYTDIVCADCADVYNPKTVRAAMGGVALCNFIEDLSVTDIKSAGYVLVCGDLGGVPVSEYVPCEGRLCLVIGNEANGISDDILAYADASVRIPITGMESLNASVSAGILMYLLKN